ncbi:hypothetical protein G7L40_20040 [Paenibacillus polymyxa]|uniref:Uncharacterized protein n=1 Tax=Paenibacillus polymyxa TaxID=1406 RepID=A0A378Y177_PAEPO|nr:hypothetical protein [Paenibacillus polymyxa]MBE7896220.1 hypothetical protein [Paenibacillus polymyxa]MCC3256749.1 hypothetical protein [Paenibacillus polymyxa]QPK54764.1 hypothetical protein G7035_20080 [Paenibacillus polymyxa]QPK59855.1 hypothetical protein G7L40_20040 [Paenibacillus polymyxa]SUA70311.1 Uncharacterised protein [Paenibacillus polymyxa]
MRVFVVLEDAEEAYVFSVNRVLVDIFQSEEAAKAFCDDHNRDKPYLEYYYEEREVRKS